MGGERIVCPLTADRAHVQPRRSTLPQHDCLLDSRENLQTVWRKHPRTRRPALLLHPRILPQPELPESLQVVRFLVALYHAAQLRGALLILRLEDLRVLRDSHRMERARIRV